MAYNPFTSFRKYQKFWLAGLILMSMVSFILCSGMGTEQWFTSLIARFTNTGEGAAAINGRTVTFNDLKDLENQRKIANDFMHSYTDLTIKHIDEALGVVTKAKKDVKNAKETANIEKVTAELKEIRGLLVDRLKQTNYFGSGTKLDDLLDFMLWREQADRLGVYLDRAAVQDQVAILILFFKIPDLQQKIPEFCNPRKSFQLSQFAEVNVKQQHQGASTEAIAEALKQEFRVQIAKLALVEVRPDALFNPNAGPFVDFVPTVRFSLTPEELWRNYQKKLTRYDIALLPVKAEQFVPKTKEPATIDLEALFKEGKGKRFNPELDSPGFIPPEQLKVAYLMADPDSPYYKGLAERITALESTPLFLDVGLPVLGTALRLAEGKTAWESSLWTKYDTIKTNLKNREVNAGEIYSDVYDKYASAALKAGALDKQIAYVFQAPLTSSGFVLPMATAIYEPDAQMAASLIAGADLPGIMSLSPFSYEAAAYLKQEKHLEPAMQKEIERRLPVGATLVLSGASPTPLATLTQWHTANSEYVFLPFSVVEPQLRDEVEKDVALKKVKEDMIAAREQLKGGQALRKETERRVGLVQEEYPGLEYHETDKFYTQFDIDKAPELQKFKTVYEKWVSKDNPFSLNRVEGRVGTERALKDDDFYKLFFDSSEPHSVASKGLYWFQEFPPEAILPAQTLISTDVPELGLEAEARGKRFDLWTLKADRPILFWKTEMKQPPPPEKLDDVKAQVVQAWKLKAARDEFAFPEAVKIAKLLVKQQERLDPQALLEEQAKKLGVEPIYLKDVSELKPYRPSDDAALEYTPYQLPRGLIPYPRTDMAAQILALPNLTKALVTKVVTTEDDKKADKDRNPGDESLDKANTELFRAAWVGTRNHQIQILTNRPRTIYYVAVITGQHQPDMHDFLTAYVDMTRKKEQGNRFVSMIRDEAARRHLESVTEQLRNDAKLEKRNTKGFE